MSPLTRREQMLKALQDAGQRGCTRREMVNLGGRHWKQHLDRIGEDYYLHGFRSRFGPQTWRWVLGHERPDLVHGETCELSPQLQILTPSGQPAFKSTARVEDAGRAPAASTTTFTRAA